QLVGMQRRDAAPPFHLLHVIVADADGPHLALLEQPVHGLRGIFHGRVRIGPVNLVDVDVVRLQVPQALLDLLADALGLGVAEHVFLLVPVHARLGRDDDLVTGYALFRQRRRSTRRRKSEATPRRGVGVANAHGQRLVYGPDGVFHFGAAPQPAADGPRAQRDAGHFYFCRSETRIFHTASAASHSRRGARRAAADWWPPAPGRRSRSLPVKPRHGCRDYCIIVPARIPRPACECSRERDWRIETNETHGRHETFGAGAGGRLQPAAAAQNRRPHRRHPHPRVGARGGGPPV